MENYETQPLHEVVYYSKAAKIKKSFSTPIHASLRDALTNPSHYLPVYSDDPLSDVYPDTSILFKLHLEYGKMINLFDMLTSFRLSVTGTDEQI